MLIPPRIRALAVLATVLFATPLPAGAATSVEIIETSPAADATLRVQQEFWVHLAYQTDEAVRLWVRPYRDGEQVDAMSNASLPHEGEGEALGWFALTAPGEVEELRVTAAGGTPYREWVVLNEPVQLEWTDTATAGRSRPAWVERLLAEEKARYAAEAKRRADEPVSVGDLAFFNGFMLLVGALLLAGIVVPLWTVWKWSGGWRLAAAVPAGVMGFVVLRILVDTARDPTSHNLWPFEILMFAPGALAAIGVLKLVRRIRGVRG